MLRRRTGIPTIIQIIDGSLSFCLPLISGVHVTDQVVADVVTYLFKIKLRCCERRKHTETHMQFQEVSKLGQFTVQVFVHGIKTFLELLLGKLADRVVCRVMVHVWKKNRLRKRRSNMFPGTTISVSTCTDLEVSQVLVRPKRG